MKIGILTFCRAHNWGAVLQTYASQRCIEKLGVSAEIIDYVPTSELKSYEPKIRMRSNLFDMLKSIVRFMMDIKLYRIRYNEFNKFISTKLKLSIPYKDKFPEYMDNYDVIYIGSDQVWRKNLAAEGYDYYWGNINVPSSTKIISYAASMEAKELSNEDEITCKKNLENFDSISVRESFLANILQPLTDKHISVVLDPTLLLKKEDYMEITSDSVVDGDYLLIYELLKNPQVDIVARQIAKQHNLKLVKIFIPLISNRVNRFNREFIFVSPSPAEFLRLFADAKFVVTNSFHGTAFSIIFEKQFLSLETEGRTSRIESLLQIIGAVDNAYFRDEKFDIECLEHLNYKEINAKLNLYRQQSMDFMKNCIM